MMTGTKVLCQRIECNYKWKKKNPIWCSLINEKLLALGNLAY